ncbi:RecQ family ATP-dependent DNA helicase [Brevibacillus brevis]|uniref:RecQ family ATP-dependent DNA helicase n=1 Tax=Brevibacillus brevis TaxID=1393 RepID=UPI0025A666ED|nr:ATP-dependent DNA helicase RecQ [Brevibacillus brevis]WJQ84013.1 ATP-dependent DNA helicase RecQ [Brevibacillus brevis]
MNKQLMYDRLKLHFGYDSFRPGQEPIIERLLHGRSVLGLLATGGGKSVTYQLPAMLLPGLTVVVSPLISLMVDQVQQLRARKKIPATYLNSMQDPTESREILKGLSEGAYKLLYISPEKLQQTYVQQVLKRARVSLIAIDEAHCISQWGHDFRTDYLRLPEVVKQLGAPPVLAVTATATASVREEICNLFSIKKEDVVLQSLNRANIAYDLVEVGEETDRRSYVFDQIDRLQGPGIVYCSTRQAVDVLAASYQLEGKKRVHGYHGGMNSMERMLIQSQFLAGELDVIIATNAFGMGIDKSDIRYVIHYQMPASLEAYAQEIGRIGRDGKPGYALLLFSWDDLQIHQHMLEKEYPTQAQVQKYEQLCNTGVPLTSEALAMMDISEEMGALLAFYTERVLGLYEAAAAGESYPKAHIIWQETEKRKSFKQKKLAEMVSYVRGENCLRASINTYFKEMDHQFDLYCCKNCGLTMAAYFQTNDHAIAKNEQIKWNLRQALDTLLPNK